MSRKSERLMRTTTVGTALSPNPLPSDQPATRSSLSTDGQSSKRALRQGKRKRSLENMLDMPFDIMFEVLSYLSPMDILNLARSTKALRSFLMRGSSAMIWKVARLNVDDLPPCPIDLNEPAYANLMFDAQCHGCLRKRCEDVYWECRVRLCNSCLHTRSTSEPLELSVGPCTVLPRLTYDFMYRPQVEKAHSELAHLAEDVLKDELEARAKRLDVIRETVPALSQWHKKTLEKKALERNRRCERREAEIIAKLTELGYKAELEFMSDKDYFPLNTIPGVDGPQKLSPRSWKSIEKRVLKFMSEIRTDRLVDALLERLYDAEDSIQRLYPRLESEGIVPLDAIVSIPQVRELIEPPVEALDTQKLENILQAEVPRFQERRLIEANRYFASLVREDMGFHDTVDPLPLAVASWFTCTRCKFDCSYPMVIRHICPCWKKGSIINDTFVEFAAEHRSHQRGIPQFSGFTSRAKAIARCVEAYGLDPSTATPEDMDRRETRLFCPHHTNARHPVMVIEVHTWRSVRSSDCAKSCDLRIFPEDQASAVIAHVPKNPLGGKANRWGVCARCPSYNRQEHAYKNFSFHLNRVHEITEESEYDWIGDSDLTPYSDESIYLASRRLRDIDPATCSQDIKNDWMEAASGAVRGRTVWIDFTEDVLERLR